MNSLSNHLNIVWLKRDLRTSDHEPLFHAENENENYILIYLFEPTLLAQPIVPSPSAIYLHSILDINSSLRKVNRSVHTFYADAKDVFTYLTERYTINKVFSYQENGTRFLGIEIKRFLQF